MIWIIQEIKKCLYLVDKYKVLNYNNNLDKIIINIEK